MMTTTNVDDAIQAAALARFGAGVQVHILPYKKREWGNPSPVQSYVLKVKRRSDGCPQTIGTARSKSELLGLLT